MVVIVSKNLKEYEMTKSVPTKKPKNIHQLKGRFELSIKQAIAVKSERIPVGVLKNNIQLSKDRYKRFKHIKMDKILFMNKDD